MNIEQLKLREFGDGAPPPVAKPAKTFLPGGSKKVEAPPPPPLPPSYTEEQVKAAEREGYKKGFLEGTKDGIKQGENSQLQADRGVGNLAKQFSDSIAPLLEDYRLTSVQMQQEMPKVALMIAKKVAGKALADNAEAMVEDLASRCIETMMGEPKITVTLNANLAATLETKLKALTEGTQGTTDIVVIPDAALPMADCRIEWKQGGFSRDTQALWQELERVTDSLQASSKHAAEEQMSSLTDTLRKHISKPDETQPDTKE